MSKIKEFTVSSKRSVQIHGEFFTFECSELISLDEKDDIEKQDLKLGKELIMK